MEKIMLLLIAIYPIAPDYFRIAGIPSGTLIAVIYISLYLLQHRFRVAKIGKAGIFIILTVVMLIPVFYHAEYKVAFRFLVEYGLLPYIICCNLKTYDSMEKTLDLITTVGAVTCIFGFYEFIFKDTMLMPLFNGSATDLSPVLQMRGAFARAEATFGHAISYAIYLSVCSLINLYFITIHKKGLYIFKYIITTITLFLTVSRAPILICIAVQLVMLWLYNYRIAVKVIISSICIVISLLGFVSLISNEMLDTVKWILTMLIAVFSDNAAAKLGEFGNSEPFTYRLELLKVIPRYLKGKELLGNGADLEFRFEMLGFTYYSIDNAYLAWLHRYGVIGFIGNIGFILRGIVGAIKRMTMKINVLYFGIMLMFMLNWCSVAQMFERKIFIVIVSLIIHSEMRSIANSLNNTAEMEDNNDFSYNTQL